MEDHCTKNGITVVWVVAPSCLGYIYIYINVSEQPDTSIFMVKELVFWDARECGLVEKYGRF
jgi:hypothetical protein